MVYQIILFASRGEIIVSNIPASYILQFSYKSLTFHWKIVDDETRKPNDEITMYYGLKKYRNFLCIIG